MPEPDSPVLVPFTPRAYQVNYSETTLPLPGFDPLFGYVYGNNCEPGPSGCFNGGRNYSQIPVLSSDAGQPFGVYYVSDNSDLVERPLAPGSSPAPARVVAQVTILNQSYASYGGMLPNEFTIEYGTDDALFFGEMNDSNLVTVETVNLSTSAVHLVPTSIPAAPQNQGAVDIGNHTVLVFTTTGGSFCTDCTATVDTVNTWTGNVTRAASLPFYEANNIYWLPQRQQLINVEADGATGDRVQQWNETPNGTFALSSTVRFDNGITENWVDGLGYNATTGRICFSAGGYGISRTYVLSYDAKGLLTANGETIYSDPARVFMGQRYVFTSEYVIGGFASGTQYLFDPWSGTTLSVNEPFTVLDGFDVCDGSCFLGDYAPSPDYLIDFHATVFRNDPFYSVVLAEVGSG